MHGEVVSRPVCTAFFGIPPKAPHKTPKSPPLPNPLEKSPKEVTFSIPRLQNTTAGKGSRRLRPEKRAKVL
jgi:hypothetical protein